MTTSCGHHHEDGGSHELVVKDLTMEYRGLVALDGVSFNARCGSSLALVGPNGAGKSTLLKGIAGLKSLRRGNITWAGEHHINCRGGEFAYLPQQEEVNWQFPITVRGVVEMGRYTQLGKFGRFGAKDMASVDAALDLMELNEELAGRQISELSGGQRQRAFIARAIAQEAHVLLLDEPFTGLDRVHTANLTRLLRKLARENRLVIASHHDVNTLADIFDQVLLLNRTLIDFGACTEVLTEENLAKTFQTSTHV